MNSLTMRVEQLEARRMLSAAKPTVFKAPILTFDSGSPSAAVTADFNTDGIPDVATITNTEVKIDYGMGKAKFAAPVIIQNVPDAFFSALVVGDFNNDGRPDLVAEGNDFLLVCLNRGKGVFKATSIPLPSGSAATAFDSFQMVAADFNHDKNLDLAVTNQINNQVDIYLGNGMGGFGKPQGFDAGTGPTALAVGDFNDDHRLDLAALDSGSGISILTGDGHGGFRSPRLTALPGISPTAMTVADLNGNGNLDIAFCFEESVNGVPDHGEVGVLYGDGGAHLSAPTYYRCGDEPLDVVAGDFNDDGRVDLVTSNQYDNSVSVLLGDATGTYQSQQSYAAGQGADQLVVGDFNRDKVDDLLVIDTGNDEGADTGFATLLGE